MTVVIEDQVKTITNEIVEQFGCECGKNDVACPFFASEIQIEHVVRAVIAQYDISSIARQDVFEQCAKIAEQWDGVDNVAAQIRRNAGD